jgi:hypothetical protein
MNKLVNLLLIFLTLQYLIPLVKIDILRENKLYMNLFAAGIIGLVQFTFNIGMVVSKRKNATLKDSFVDALFKMIIVLGGFYIFQDLQSNDNVLATALKSNNIFESVFLTIIITFFILIKCLITP